MGESSIPSENERYRAATRHFDNGDGASALALAQPLAANGYDPADFLLGMIYEFGSETSEIDISKAVTHYRRSALSARDAIALRYLARALMKSGSSNYGAALRFLEDARAKEPSPEIDLGFAWLYETGSEPKYRLAKRHYLRAAAHGRFLGFFGYSRVARKDGHPLEALAMDCARVVSGVFIFLIVGRKARREF